jgi:hypothetical protein
MFLSAHHKPMMREALNHKVFDAVTGKEILHVIWANDETGRYRKYITDENGKIVTFDYFRNGKLSKIREIKSKIFKGQIEFRRIA